MNGQKVLKTRMIQKHEYEADWNNAINFIPLESEIVVYDAEADQDGNLLEGAKLPNGRTTPYTYARIKIGDGKTNVKDLPFIDENKPGEKTIEGGEIFNDYKNNAAIGEGTSARGLNTQAGTLARKIVSNGIKICKDENNSEYYEITIKGLVNSDNLCVDPWIATDSYVDGTSDLVTIDCGTHLSNALYINEIVENNEDNTTTITVKRIDNGIFATPYMADISGANMEEDWMYVPGKLNGVISPQFTSAFVGGKDSIATGFAAVALGRDNISSGNYAVTFGRGNKASYAGLAIGSYSEAGNISLAAGNYVRALGNASVATGVRTYARAASSRAGGRFSEALSEFTVAEGLGVIAGLKQGQVVHGKYNVRSDSDLFIIGDGTASNNRHNAFRITEDYKVFLNNNSIELANVVQVNNLLKGSVSINGTNEVTGELALATGKNTHAKGQGSTAICIDTVAEGQGSFAAGVGSKALARSAIAVGEKNYATQQGAFAAGINSHAEGYATIALGNGVKTINAASVYGQMAVGKYNLPNSYSLFMVGNGTSKDDRRNVFEVRNDGSAYLETQGTEPNAVVIKSELDSSIADVISKLASAGLKREVVEVLPEISAADESTIYMVANNDNVNENVYDEYMFINGNWEIIGSTVVDLTSKPGEKTADGGEIFNDYSANDAIGFGASASGRNSKAGSRAFKIISIEESVGNLPILGDTDYITNEYIKSYYNKLTESQVCTVLWHYTQYDTAVEVYDKDDNLIFTEYWREDNSKDGTEEEKHYVEIDSDGNVVSIKDFLGYTEGVTGGYDITVRGDVTVSGHNEPYSVGDLLQIECKGHLNNSYKIAKIAVSGDNSIITAEKVDERIISAPVLETNDPDNEENWLYVAGKNGAEISPQLTAAFVAGDGNIASGWASAAFGRDNIASGNYSTAFGRQNVAGYCGISGGRRSESGEQALAVGSSAKALGIASVATGSNTFARAHASRAGGLGSRALHERSVADGCYVTATAQDQHAIGRYNRSNNEALFIVGNGTSTSNKSNAFEVRKDGTAWLQTQGQLDNSVVIKKTLDDKFLSGTVDPSTLEDVPEGTVYFQYIDEAPKSEMILTDKTTGANYSVYIDNGVLKMEVIE